MVALALYGFFGIIPLYIVHCVFLGRYIRTHGYGVEPTGTFVFPFTWIDRYRAYRIAKVEGHMPWSLVVSTLLEITIVASIAAWMALSPT